MSTTVPLERLLYRLGVDGWKYAEIKYKLNSNSDQPAVPGE